MKILAIRLKNLTSIEGALEIDFTQEPLHSAGIFAISGPTGAGKSTILDALCLALYDRAPRFAASVETVYLTDVGTNQISQADVKNILRRGMSEGYAEVDFEGMTGHRYRSRWAVRRTRSMADGSLRTQTLQVTNLDTEEELQGGKRELLAQLVEAIGLTYEQFTRTVLLAQNDFAT
ncbi:MAG: AAA family ATPase, partial [Bacteroides sp.]|uniref:AAA family ATPase n=1 Tax=Bacteroides sp. TaxID=29523 RepID=UPI001B5CC0AF